MSANAARNNHFVKFEGDDVMTGLTPSANGLPYARTAKITGLRRMTLISGNGRPATPVHFFVMPHLEYAIKFLIRPNAAPRTIFHQFATVTGFLINNTKRDRYTLFGNSHRIPIRCPNEQPIMSSG